LRITERRKDNMRRQLAELLPILTQYVRGKDSKEIARIISQRDGKPVSSWWVRAKIRKIIKSL
jgi:hypothetical protein